MTAPLRPAPGPASRAGRAKVHGIHYTPPGLAAFLAEAVLRELPTGDDEGPVAVLDPACGDGGLLRALARAAPRALRGRLVLVGFETDADALERARAGLRRSGVAAVVLERADFLAADRGGSGTPEAFEAVVANPPFVRTQVLGAARARALARRFGLGGRVDLYQAFVRALADAVRPGGVLGLIAPNRLLSIRAGADVRRLLRTGFDLRAVVDLGDTRLFPAAAVLPAVVVARRGEPEPGSACGFRRVYEDRAPAVGTASAPRFPGVLAALDAGASGPVRAAGRRYVVERGTLATPDGPGGPWCLATPGRRNWLDRLAAAQAGTVADAGRVRVGIKTTADRVFLRADWDDLPAALCPEPELLRPVLTHRDAARWAGRPEGSRRRVLYPHRVVSGRRAAVELDGFPRARAYLEAHRAALEARAYLRAAGRRWYELWVPQDPDSWARPKVVFPDIAERPRAFLDTGGAVVNGDCYWIAPEPGGDPRLPFVLLAVLNSSLAVAYYDARYHNRLYAGRRRFITQYVETFPLPDPDHPAAAEALGAVGRLVTGDVPADERTRLEADIDRLVWAAFDLPESE